MFLDRLGKEDFLLKRPFQGLGRNPAENGGNQDVDVQYDSQRR